MRVNRWYQRLRFNIEFGESFRAVPNHPRYLALGIALTSLLSVGVGRGSEAAVQSYQVADANMAVMQLAQAETQTAARAIAQIVTQAAAKRAGVPVAQVKLEQLSPKSFENDCVFQFGTICNDIYKPIAGWEATVKVATQPTWRYHLNRSGSVVVAEPQLAQTSPGNPMPGAHIDGVIMDAARRAKVSPAAIKILSSQSKTFGNTCEFNFGEICTKEYRPIAGYEVIAQVQGKPWKYHVNQAGTQVVLDPKLAAATTTMPLPLQNRVKADAAKRSGLPTARITIVRTEQKTFGNACEFGFGEICTMDYRPIAGWVVEAKVGSQIWTYHIDRTGSQLVLDPAITATVGLPSAIRQAILQDAAAWATAAPVNLQTAKTQTWGNACAFNFGQICPANYDPIEGWQVTVKSGDLAWTYHASKDGKQVVMDRRNTLPKPVAEAIARDLQKRHGPAAKVENLRFLMVKEEPREVCFLFSGCRTEMKYLVAVANGTKQWGYEADERGQRVTPIAIADVYKERVPAVSQR